MKKQPKINKTTKENLLLLLLNFTIPYSSFILTAAACLSLSVKQSLLFYISIAVAVGGFFISGFITGRKKKRKGLIYSVLFSIPALISVVLVSLIINKFECDYMTGISSLAMLAAASIGGIIAVNIKKK